MEISEKKSSLINEVFLIIKKEKILPGQSLPAERKLAAMLDVSRNSVREIIRILEERGIVEVYQGSGCYLKREIREPKSVNEKRSFSNPDEIKNQLEARFILIPRLGTLAMERIDERNIKRLEETLIRLSRAIIDRNITSIIKEDNYYREILAESTGNNVLMMMTKQLEQNNHIIWEVFTSFPEEGMNKIFACFVQTLNAIRSCDIEQVRHFIENNVFTMCMLLTEFTGITFNEQIYSSIKTDFRGATDDQKSCVG